MCQVLSDSDQGFSIYRATFTHAHCDKVITISSPPYYVVSVDKTLTEKARRENLRNPRSDRDRILHGSS